MGRGKFKVKPTGRRNFSTPEELDAGTSACSRTIRQDQTEYNKKEGSEEGSGEDSGEEVGRRKGTISLIEIQNPNFVKPRTTKAKDANLENATQLTRREREEIEKQRAHERYMRLQEQGKTEQSRKDLERLALIRRQRAEAAKKRQEEKAAKELKRAETETDLPPAFFARDKKGALRSQS
uniref:Casein kinase substrate phosphoprotein PP28 domain-containing protein n=1 Tax=Musa acuminata subsp. malaccensis TaxID=214687 RepID=A0A804JJJ8_MUSAM|nr:PREDICTED: 28 kDa heat- and acid-stable phosphoprotein isoform X2 [Musa acuminata subsp. malaccensis]